MQRSGSENVPVWASFGVIWGHKLGEEWREGRNGAGVLSRGQSVKDTQVEVSKPDLAPAFFLHFGARDPVTDAFGSRDHSAGQSGHSLPLALTPPPYTWCSEGSFSPLVGIQVGGFVL